MTTAELKSLEEMRRYVQDLVDRRVEDDPRIRRLQSAKRITWLFMLVLSFLFYYLIDKMGEALSLLR